MLHNVSVIRALLPNVWHVKQTVFNNNNNNNILWFIRVSKHAIQEGGWVDKGMQARKFPR